MLFCWHWMRLNVDQCRSCLHDASLREHGLCVYSTLMYFLSCRGKFAVVRKCVEKCSGQEYAAKFMRKRRKGQDCRTEIIHEIAVLELATASRRVVNLHQVYEMASEMVLVLELWVSNLHSTPKHSHKPEIWMHSPIQLLRNSHVRFW